MYVADHEAWRDLSDLPGDWPGCVATIGVFDGFHRGHRALVDRAIEVAAALRVPSVLVTFDPHPLEVVSPGRAPRLIATLNERVREALAAGIDGVYVQHFDERFAQVPAEKWAAEFLAEGLGARAVVVGEDFRFGASNAGDVETLRTVGLVHDFDAHPLPLVRSQGQRCSSTLVRELQGAGRFDEARALLGLSQ